MTTEPSDAETRATVADVRAQQAEDRLTMREWVDERAHVLVHSGPYRGCEGRVMGYHGSWLLVDVGAGAPWPAFIPEQLERREL